MSPQWRVLQMKGKTVVVTGASNGIGFITALELARLGARVLIVVRNAQKGQATLEAIKKQTGQTAELFLADLSLVAQTRRVAAAIKAAAPTIDVLVNNAGGLFMERLETSEGLEMTFALNHMGYFALTTLLLDHLKATTNARVVNVSSDGHKTAKIDWDDLQAKQTFNLSAVYGNSKLMNLLFSNELARQLEGTGVTSNALNPGMVATGIGQNVKGVWKLLIGLAKPFFLTPERGAQTSIYLASSQEVQTATGLYWDKNRPIQPSAAALDQTHQKRLWLESEKIMAGL
jgi:NAD(P)-dependent dehydrogenase (short-subunit alcohol dehydrogenase family)